MKKLAYNKADFKELQEKKYLYVDKTRFIEFMSEDYQDITDGLFLRPRRFGKSLFLSTLDYYYDINSKDLFAKLFGVGKDAHTYIGGKPTKEANSFYILNFDFSTIDASDKTKLLENFNTHVLDSINAFITKYKINVSYTTIASTSGTLGSFLKGLEGVIGKKLIILIDEYDHFTNDILSDIDYFKGITGKEGFVRSFYATIKSHRQKGCLAKVILTGVSSVLLDSLTSGANNITNYSMDSDFNELFGFTKDEVLWLMDELEIKDKKKEILNDLEEKYNGYLFSETTERERVFNSNLVNMYLQKYIKTGRPPKTTKGTNILTDDKKITSMLDLYHNVESKEKIIMEIITNKKIESSYFDSFDLGGQLDEEQFKHLLYYLGVLTIDSEIEEGYMLRIPNIVTEEVFYDTLKRYVNKQYQLDSNFYKKTKLAIKNFIETDDLSELNKIFQSEFTRLPKDVFSNFYEVSIQISYYLAFLGYKDIEVTVEQPTTKIDEDNNFESGRTDITIISKERIDIIDFKYLSATKYKEKTSLFEEQKQKGIEQLEAYKKGYELHNIENKKINKHLIMYISGVCKLYKKLD